jgi:hypothetical protein
LCAMAPFVCHNHPPQATTPAACTLPQKPPLLLIQPPFGRHLLPYLMPAFSAVPKVNELNRNARALATVCLVLPHCCATISHQDPSQLMTVNDCECTLSTSSHLRHTMEVPVYKKAAALIGPAWNCKTAHPQLIIGIDCSEEGYIRWPNF